MGFPLDGHEIFRSNDFEEAREALARIWRPHRLEKVARTNGLDFHLHGLRMQQVTVSVVKFGGEVLIDTGLLGMFAVVLPTSGRCVVRSGGQETTIEPGRAGVLSPISHVSTRWTPDCVLVIFGLDPLALEAHLSNMIGTSLPEPLLFDVPMNTRTGHGMRLVSGVLRPLIAKLDSGDKMLDGRAAVSRIEHTLMSGLLLAQPNNYSAALADIAKGD